MVPETVPVNSLVQALRVVIHHLPNRRRWQFGALVGLMLMGAVAELVTIGALIPFLGLISGSPSASDNPIAQVVSDFIGSADASSVLVLFTSLFAVVVLTAGGVRLLLSWFSLRFTFQLGHDLGVKVYKVTLYQPYKFHYSRNTSEIIAGVNKVQIVVNQVIKPIIQSMISIIISIFIMGALMYINPAVAITTGAGFVAIYVAVSMMTRQRLRANSVILATKQTQSIKTIGEGLGGIRDVLIDQSQAVYIDKFKNVDSAFRKAQTVNGFIAVAPRYIIEASGMVLIAMLALILSRQSGGLVEALPVLGALAFGAHRLLPLLQQLYNAWSQVVGNRQAMFDVVELLNQPLPTDFRSRAENQSIAFVQKIEFQNVNFRYTSDGADTLTDVSVVISKGSRVGIIGKTGSGKSTLMDLAMGLIEPTKGVIRVDGTELKSLTRHSWQSQIAHVPQAIYLADSSIAENIAFGVSDEKIDFERIKEAARRAEIASFIETLPRGYSTQVGERGIRLSGGQRQRIGIARALYKGAQVLILDEATSALDSETEASVMDAISQLGGDLTILIIAHRLTTVAACDWVVQLDKGRIVASGPYDKVIHGSPRLEFSGR